jgi:glycine dehydrogenase subunit 2
LVKSAPHATPVRRLDEARAARKPVLRWEGGPSVRDKSADK